MSRPHVSAQTPRVLQNLPAQRGGPAPLCAALVFLAFVLAGLAVCHFAFAGTRDATLSWSPVTLNTDGTPAKITAYKIWRGWSSAQSSMQLIATVDANTFTYFDAHPPAQVNYYAVSAVGQGTDAAGKPILAESSLSAVAKKRIRLPAPSGGRVLPTTPGGVVLPSNP